MRSAASCDAAEAALDREARALAWGWWGPFLLVVIGGLMVAPETLGPLVTLGVWLVVLVRQLVRALRGRPPGEPLAVSLELVPVIGAVAVIQLLLDLHTRWLGDLVVAALHVLAVAGVLIRRRQRARRQSKRGRREAPPS
jgi:hypothetical protein